MTTFKGFALTIAGCEYAFTTGGLPSLTSSSALWPSPTLTADGFLVRPAIQWTETAKPIDGDLDVSGIRVQLHDATSSSHPLLTYLATRDATNVASTPLAADITATALTFTVGSGSVLGSFPRTVWLEGEAIYCDSIATNTVTVNASGRGYLGTIARAHTIDDSQALHPEVFRDFPWITRRKVCLWGVDAAGACTLLYTGFAIRAPTLSPDGARFDLSLESMWATQQQCPVGGTMGATRIVGYGRSGVAATTTTANADSLFRTTWAVTYSGTVRRFSVVSIGPFRDWTALVTDQQSRAATASTAAAARIDLHISRDGRHASVGADVLTATVPSFSIGVALAGRTIAPVLSTATSTRQVVNLDVADIPAVLHLGTEGAYATFPVSGLGTLPTTWSTTTTTDDTYTTSETPSLRCQHSEDWTLLLEGCATADAGGSIGPTVTGTASLVPRKPGLRLESSLFVLTDPPPLFEVVHVRTGHWVYGLKRSVIGLCEDAAAADWDWTDVTVAARATAGLRVSRDWLFDGRRTLGSVVKECCLLHGCSPVMRSGRLALHAWKWPDAHTSPAVSLTKTDIIGLPSWQRWQDGLANRFKVTSPDLTVDASQASSRGRYGPGRQISVELAGLDEQASPIDDPADFARTILGRMELWSDPLGVVKLTVSGAYLTTLELGSELAVTEWMLPDGAGARGLSAVRAFVTSRTIDLATATIAIEAIVYTRYSYPYAPCARVSSQVSTTVVECAAAGYVNGVSSYSGGNDTTTFSVGDKVDILARDASGTVDAGQTISGINTGTRRITFASAMSAGIQAKIAAGVLVDVRFATFATPVVAGQQTWMFVGDDATGVIGGTATATHPIAP